MSDASWWRDKLSGGRPQYRAPAPPPYQPPPAAPPQQVPGWHAGVQAPPAPSTQQPVVQRNDQGFVVNQQGQVDTFASAMVWQGVHAKEETAKVGHCPECGSDHYFSRSWIAEGNQREMPRRGPSPAPYCADCGFNGLFAQGSGIGAVVEKGATAPSRQAPSPPSNFV